MVLTLFIVLDGDDDELDNRLIVVEYAVVTDDDAGESLYFEENAVVDVSVLLFRPESDDVRWDVDGKLVDGT